MIPPTKTKQLFFFLINTSLLPLRPYCTKNHLLPLISVFFFRGKKFFFLCIRRVKMRMSCNGCRVLRKGCNENCSIRPCLQWIKSAEAQANATVFLAKFYGRAGLLNLINAGPDHLRPSIFRSLLYEACGRIVNPIYGSVGLLWSGNWHLCQAAVEAVMKGSPITALASEAAETGEAPPLKVYDIRHVPRDDNAGGGGGDGGRVVKSRCRSKRAAGTTKPRMPDVAEKMLLPAADAAESGHACGGSTSHDSSLSHQSEFLAAEAGGDSKDEESMVSEEPTAISRAPVEEIGLELTLGLEPMSRDGHAKKRKVEVRGTCEDDDSCRIELGLDYV
ncbi:PREDICTED: LOB domain-containing protein 40 [Tarenaya hassleriana]|uniref:LOB domain-containing protein 40 n=1 Tax=Tarenaya hassleriana TaxID=28532 RepID=UPI00053C720E|nr:PREDICTED: LOB domain-containing protein 40 [Tarenaya hassleriana]